MNKRAIGLAVSILLFLLTNNLYSEIPSADNFESRILYKAYTAKAWKQLQRTQKELYIRGIYEGAGCILGKEAEEVFISNVNYESLISAVDTFYSDYKNMKIPVAHALLIITMEIRGEEKNKIDETLRELRVQCEKISENE